VTPASYVIHATIRLSLVMSLAMTACAPTSSNEGAPILLFNGTGTSPNDVAAIKTLLQDNHLQYSTVNSQELNRMSEARLMSYRLLIVPGGNYLDIGNSLDSSTMRNVHNVVQSGLNYLGICAGGILAGHGPYNSLDLTSGVRFDFYAVVNQGIHKAAVPISGVDSPMMEHYWEDGPQFTGWGEIVAKYPDDTPAVAQGFSGKGWVVLSGVHPEAPQNWRNGMTFTTPTSVDNDYAVKLIDAALHKKPLPHY
jgi:glutamine amidotransferase-like uncharacterized protein